MKEFFSKSWFLALAIVLLPAGALSQNSREAVQEPEVMAAVAPAFMPMARSARAQGNVIIEVTVNSRGEVESSKAISGHPLLQGTSNAAAKKWKFAPARDGDRIVRLTFSFGYSDTLKNHPESTVTFMPPYKVEILVNQVPVDY